MHDFSAGLFAENEEKNVKHEDNLEISLARVMESIVGMTL
jgi:hypothetical protein